MLLPEQPLITDHSPSSNTATSSFHRTAILFFQHPLGKVDEREVPDFQIKQKKLKKLPSYYTDIKPATLNKTITIEETSALKYTLNDIPSAKQVVMTGRKNNDLIKSTER